MEAAGLGEAGCSGQDRSLDQSLLGQLRVLHKSQHFVVVDKDWDVRINSSNHPKAVTVSRQLAAAFPWLVSADVEFGFRFAHRLDYATSGCLAVALTKDAASAAAKAFQQRRASKLYVALLRGEVSWRATEAAAAIGRLPGDGPCRMAVRQQGRQLPDTRSALTRFWLLERGTFDGRPASKVLVEPLSGRTHQIRVHAAHLGHHVVGDASYSWILSGTDASLLSFKTPPDSSPARMCLHAWRLRLPTSLESLSTSAPDPFTEDATQGSWRSHSIVQSWTDCVEWDDDG